MTMLVLGLLLFLGTHSIRIVANDWRTRTLARVGDASWKAIVSVIAIIGLVLIAWGYGIARTTQIVLWHPPFWTRHVAAALIVPAFVLITAAYIPGNRIKTKLGHPMVAGVKLWAFAHLLANGGLADIVLFGTFLVWAALDFRAARERDRAGGVRYPRGRTTRDIAVLALGLVAWWVFARYLHAWLTGVQPFA